MGAESVTAATPAKAAVVKLVIASKENAMVGLRHVDWFDMYVSFQSSGRRRPAAGLPVHELIKKIINPIVIQRNLKSEMLVDVTYYVLLRVLVLRSS